MFVKYFHATLTLALGQQIFITKKNEQEIIKTDLAI